MSRQSTTQHNATPTNSIRHFAESIKENFLDTELIYCYAKTNDLAAMEEFVTGPNCANIQSIGDRCFNEGQYQAAKVLFSSINNYPKKARCHLKLNEYEEAVIAAETLYKGERAERGVVLRKTRILER